MEADKSEPLEPVHIMILEGRPKPLSASECSYLRALRMETQAASNRLILYASR